MTTADPAVLRKAADIIERQGLLKGSFSAGARGSHCTVGALLHAKDGDLLHMKAISAEIDLLADMIGRNDALAHDYVIFNWNDAPDRTADDVITLLEQAAQKAEANQPTGG